MTRNDSSVFHEWLPITLIVGVGLMLRLAIAWTDTPTLVTKTLPDDAFYYFVIVDNALTGQGVTFDRIAPTNGFHPLWALILAPIFALAPTRDVGIHLALSLSALFDLGVIYLAFRAGKALLSNDSRAGLFAAAIYAFSPRVVMENVNGLETAVSTFFFALTSTFYLSIVRRLQRGRPRAGWPILLGVLVGLTTLARTDSILFVGLILIDLVRRLLAPAVWVEPRQRSLLSRRLLAPLGTLSVVGAVMVAVLSPWVVWNWLTFGTPLQTSGIAVPYVVRTYLFELSGVAGWMRLVGPFLYLGTTLAQTMLDYALLPLCILAGCVIWRSVVLRGVAMPGWSPGWAVPLLGASLILCAHAFGRFFLRGWYAIPFAFCVSVLAGVALESVIHAGGRRGWALRALPAALAVTITALLVAGSLTLWQTGFYPWQSSMLRAAQWANAELSDETPVGAFNAGIMGWFSGRRTLNLDGVVSDPAFEAIRRESLLEFVRRHDIHYIIDWQSSVERTYAPFFEEGYLSVLEPVRHFPAPSGGSETWDDLIAYRIKQE